MCVCVCAQSLDGVRLFVTAWTVAHQDPLSMRFCRQQFWIGSLFLPSGDLPDPEIEPKSPASPRSSIGRLITTEPPRKVDWLAINSFHFCVSENDFILSFSPLLVLPCTGCALNWGQHFSKALFILLHFFSSLLQIALSQSVFKFIHSSASSNLLSPSGRYFRN